MSKSIFKLTVKQVNSLAKPGRYNDGGGLYLYIREGGSKAWTYRYRQDGKLKEMSFGPVTVENSLRLARAKAHQAREGVRSGKSPLAEKRKVKLSSQSKRQTERQFGDIVDEFFVSKDKTGFYTSDRTRRRWFHCLNHHAKGLHHRSISDIKTRDVYKILEPIWTVKTETASRTRLYIEAVLSWAKTMDYRQGENPAMWRGNLDQLLAPKNRVSPVKHHPGMAWQDIPEFYSRLVGLDLPSAKLLEFIILTAARSGEARGAVWSEIDMDNLVWTIPPQRMKMKRPHIVPIQDRIIELLEEAKQYQANELVFANPKSGHQFSYNAPMVVLKKMELTNLTVHGFRSSFKTWALESTNYPTQAVEFSLAHETKNAVEAAYIRGNRMLEKRRDIMKAWGDYCLGKTV